MPEMTFRIRKLKNHNFWCEFLNCYRQSVMVKDINKIFHAINRVFIRCWHKKGFCLHKTIPVQSDIIGILISLIVINSNYADALNWSFHLETYDMCMLTVANNTRSKLVSVHTVSCVSVEDFCTL
jgi:hypothetical protein